MSSFLAMAFTRAVRRSRAVRLLLTAVELPTNEGLHKE